MKKHLIVTGMVLVLLVVGLSGCIRTSKTNDETDNKKEYTYLPDGTKVYGDFDKIEITEYTVTTDRRIGFMEYETIANGFVYSKNASRYLVNVTVKNIANELIDWIYLYVYFYDNQGNELYSGKDTCRDMYINDTCCLEVHWYNSSSPSYFEHMDYIEFEVSG